MARIGVVGGGVAGLRVARALGALLVTDQETFTFLPCLTEEINRGERGFTRPIGDCHQPVLHARVARVDTERNVLHCTDGTTVPYDVLVVATGSRARMAVPGAQRYALPFHTLAHARALKERLPAKRIVVVGGGPTGVELSLELSLHGAVTLLQATPTIIPQFSEKTQRYAQRALAAHGVHVRCDRPVARVTKTHVVAGERVPYDLLVWTAGVEANVPDGLPGERGILVDECLRVQGTANVFALGDCAQSGAPLAAQAAVQAAPVVARNVRRLLAGKPLAPFRYQEHGKLLSLGTDAYLEWLVDVRGPLAALLRNAYYRFEFARYRWPRRRR